MPVLEVTDEQWDPTTAPPWVRAGTGVTVMLVFSACLLAVAPLFMPESYSWLEHGTSESAGQGLEAAWVARSGFIMFGLAVIWLCTLRAANWKRRGTVLHLSFGVCMIGVAAFPTRPWDDTTAYLHSEDLLHSIFASVMGVAFIGGVIAVMVERRATRHATLDLAAVALVVALSAGMAGFAATFGLLQRVMFLVAYCWYGREAIVTRRPPLPRTGTHRG